MQAWFVIEDPSEEGMMPQVRSWRMDREVAMEEAKALAEASHDVCFMLVAAEEGVDPVTCITAETLCVWRPGKVYDAGKIFGGQLLVEEMREREARQDERSRTHGAL